MDSKSRSDLCFRILGSGRPRLFCRTLRRMRLLSLVGSTEKPATSAKKSSPPVPSTSNASTSNQSSSSKEPKKSASPKTHSSFSNNSRTTSWRKYSNTTRIWLQCRYRWTFYSTRRPKTDCLRSCRSLRCARIFPRLNVKMHRLRARIWTVCSSLSFWGILSRWNCHGTRLATLVLRRSSNQNLSATSPLSTSQVIILPKSEPKPSQTSLPYATCE